AGISSYKIYRSVDDNTYSFVGSSTSTTYIDAGLSQQEYYYYVKACDSTNNCSANSADVSLLPTGKFTEPANLTSEPKVSGVTTRRATIEWSTDRESDSKVALGTTSGKYSPSEVGSSDQTTSHSLDLDNLSAGTTYYYVVKWTDEDGNTGVSQEVSFSTAPAPGIKEVSTIKIGLNSAVIQFTSKDSTRAVVNFGRSESMGGAVEINTSLSESTYNLDLPGLDDGVKYYYRVTLMDNEGGDYPGDIYSFETPPRPRITDLRFQPIDDQPTSTQLVSWKTNVPTSSMVTYGITGSNGKDISDNSLTTEHEMTIKDLEDDKEYFLLAQSRDRDGNLAVSERQVFRTALDTRPPKISDITVETTIRGSGAEARGQIIVSWKTDEPSTSQVAYAEGSSVVIFNNKTAEDTSLATEHIVIISDLPTSRVYSIMPISRDRSQNTGEGENKTAIIGRSSDSVLTVVLNSLRKVFGF
ncbi:fibronectin type III domain-containing protein, partial [Candidatus Saccharibacteria bacterium]|nr:fibronectin type III domain-containing protein [Candidatus Saccharibacteria bacterium]